MIVTTVQINNGHQEPAGLANNNEVGFLQPPREHAYIQDVHGVTEKKEARNITPSSMNNNSHDA